MSIPLKENSCNYFMHDSLHFYITHKIMHHFNPEIQLINYLLFKKGELKYNYLDFLCTESGTSHNTNMPECFKCKVKWTAVSTVIGVVFFKVQD